MPGTNYNAEMSRPPYKCANLEADIASYHYALSEHMWTISSPQKSKKKKISWICFQESVDLKCEHSFFYHNLLVYSSKPEDSVGFFHSLKVEGSGAGYI